jgi:hypothetical protein
MPRQAKRVLTNQISPGLQVLLPLGLQSSLVWPFSVPAVHLTLQNSYPLLANFSEGSEAHAIEESVVNEINKDLSCPR